MTYPLVSRFISRYRRRRARRLQPVSPETMLLACTRYLVDVCTDGLSMLQEETDPDPEVVQHYTLLRRVAEDALAMYRGELAISRVPEPHDQNDRSERNQS